MQEHDFEPHPGLPEVLPEGERMLWQGSPDARSLALHTFHVRKLAVYFGALIVLRIGFALSGGVPLNEAIGGSIGFVVIAAVALGLLVIYARHSARASRFTITSERIVIRCGIAVPVTMNLPFARIESADLRLHDDGTGDIAMRTDSQGRVSYILLWPFVKPWRLIRVRPVLRGLPDAESVTSILTEAFSGHVTREAAAPEIADDRPEPRKAPRRRRWSAYPTVPLAAACSLAVIALIAVAWVRLSGEVPRGEASYEVAASVELIFEDRDDGAVVVIDADRSSVIDVLESGTNGFVRGALRSFARHRRAAGAGTEVPFSVRLTESGRLLLHDLATGREIDLRAFGATNAGVFSRFLDTAQAEAVVEGSDIEIDDEDVVALTRQEVQQ